MGSSSEIAPPESEREDGEIIEVIEYEEISSDEEFNLRQRIGELEARNQELEKIACISSEKPSEYDIGFGQQHYTNGITNVEDVSDDEEIAFVPNYRNSSRSHRKADRSGRRRKVSDRNERRRERSSRKQAIVPSSSRHQRQSFVVDKQRSRRTHRNTKSRKIASSSSDENEYRLDRNELRAALATSIHANKPSSLQRKLRGIQDTVTELININCRGEHEPHEVSASIEILEILDTLTEEIVIRTPSDEEIIRVSDESNPDHETMSLEEQELRLIALKSAILKKHEQRKKRKALDSRPYSPTDVEIIFDSSATVRKEVLASQNSKVVRIEPENMDISPAISPALQDKTLQHVDMDLASDDESAMDVSAENEFNSWIPLLTATTSNSSNDRNQFDIFQTSLLPPPPPPPPPPQFHNFSHPPPEMPKADPVVPYKPSITNSDNVVLPSPILVDYESNMDDDEDSLRAMLLAKSAKPKISKPLKSSEIAAVPGASEPMADSSMEAEQLRSLLLQSLATKSPKIKDQKENRVQAVSLKAAVKRIKSLAGQLMPGKKNIANDINLVKENIPNEEDRKTPKKKASIIKPPIKPKVRSPVIVKNMENTNLIALQPLSSQPTAENVPTVISVTVPDISKEPLQTTDVTKSVITAKLPTSQPAVTKKPAIIAKPAVKVMLTSKPVVTAKPAVTAEPVVNNMPAVTTELLVAIKPSDTKKPAITTKPEVTAKVETAQPAMTAKPLATKRKIQNTTSTLLANAKKPKPNPVRSKIITNLNPKQIEKFVIRLDESDSDDDELVFNGLDANPTDGDRFFDNASPASIAMNSPIRSPVTIPNDSANTNALPFAFEQKLDMFLKSVRNMENEKRTIKVKEPIVFSPTPAVVQRPISTVPTTPLVVRHLPESAQDEYRRLINRMNQLEAKRATKVIKKPAVNTTQALHSVKETTEQRESLAVVLPNLPTAKRTVVLRPKVATAPKAKSLVKELLVKNVTLKLSSQQQSSIIPPNATVDISQQKTVSEAVTPTTETISSIPEAVKLSKQIPKPDSMPEEIPLIEPVSTKNIFNASIKRPPFQMTAPAAAKADILKINEDEFTKHSYEFLDEMNDMHRSVCAAQEAKRKQLAIQRHLERLRAQVAHYETALAIEKDNVSKLYPCISTSRQNILKRRMKNTELSSACQKIGVAIFGTSYRTPADIRHRIVERLKDISCETKKLKDLRNNNFDASTLPPIFSNAEMVSKACQTENTKSASSLVIESLPSVVNDDLIENVQSDDANCQPNAEKNTTDASVASCSMHSLDLLQANDTREVSTMEIAVCQADVQYHKLDGNEDEAEHDDEQAVHKYQSPLDHMQHKSSGNLDAVLCPFQLMGLCEDKECSYRHL